MRCPPILIKSTDKANFATHDHQLTTNREERTGREEDREITMHGLRNQATTKSVSNGTLSQLLQSLKQTRMDPNMPQMPNKQSKKYHIDLGQNVSQYPPLLPLNHTVTANALFPLYLDWAIQGKGPLR